MTCTCVSAPATFISIDSINFSTEKFIFSLGYKHEMIIEFLNAEFPTLNYQCAVEEEPLGTGGAIQLACKRAMEKHVVVVNGDTIFKTDIQKAASFHIESNAECTLLLKPMQDFDRYGVVELDNDCTVKSFKEKINTAAAKV